MTRDEFMKELAYLLQDIQDEDKDDAVQYYTDYFEEAGPDKEAEVIRELGSPERIAAIIRADIAGHLEDGGEFTEQGYQDERFRDPGYAMAKRLDLPKERESVGQGNYGRGQDSDQEQSFNHGPGEPYTTGGNGTSQTPPPRTSKVIKLILWAVLIIVAFPVFLGVGGGLLGLAAGILGILVAVLVALGATTFAVLLGGLVMLPYGVFHMFSHPLDGLMASGTGLILLGAGALFLALSVLFYGRFVPFVIRGIVNGLSRLLHRGR
ncbi:MAG: DUF1700 domain-containing protein [Clostridia bacterium]|nr:DUF1700 domain-containing protein [Clostridia bacterium]